MGLTVTGIGATAARTGASALVVGSLLMAVATRDRGGGGEPVWGSAERASRLIDVNAARGELQLLPGIGPALSERIVEDRERRGAFASVAELERVRGIGPRTVIRVRAWCAAR